MSSLDMVVLLVCVLGTLAVGARYFRRNRRSVDMFSAGNRSPWWVAGLSSFMTLKSAGTFVVWGGLAYREGVVAIAINTCIGLSGLLVGWLLAGRWRRIGVATPAEFVEIRFGRHAVQFYTWIMMAVRIITTGVALYAVSVMLVALLPLEPGNPLRDDATGRMSLHAAIVLFGLVVVAYTALGGLWAVLITDVMQFIILQLSVVFLIPLLWFTVRSGIPLEPLPPGFFFPLSDQYSWWFMAGWVGVHFFLVGAEWAFAQRYLCVPTERDAKKSAWLFGSLYLVSPALWLTPPILFRMLDARADPEQAYVLAAQAVLPVGMLGLMMAAMFSATASAISGQINVFAGVLTEQFFRRTYRPDASERSLLRAGRAFTVAIGSALIVVAMAIPFMGGAEAVVLTITGLLFAPLMAPTVWGMFSGRIGKRAVFASALASFATGFVVRLGARPGGFLDGTGMASWIQANPRLADVLIGMLLPLSILSLEHLLSRREQPRWQEIRDRLDAYAADPPVDPTRTDHSPARVMAISFALLGSWMLGLAPINPDERAFLLAFGFALLAMAGISGFGPARALIRALRSGAAPR